MFKLLSLLIVLPIIFILVAAIIIVAVNGSKK